jgi:hypothetical protein
MRTFSLFLLITLLLSGCASVPSKTLPPSKNAVEQPAKRPPKAAPALAVASQGIIFGKADFRGLLKVEFVKLNIVDELHPEKTYELFFGDRTGEDLSPVEPHYFFLELPASKYRITSISIPVGTTLATEKTDIAFTVDRGTLLYLGTLRVTGTDQRIRFGAVPLIRPGFDYNVEILNEKDEAVREFRAHYPQIKRDIEIKLMQNLHIQAY